MAWSDRFLDAVVPGRKLRAMIEGADLSGLPDAAAWPGWPEGWRTPMWNAYSWDESTYERVTTVWACVDLITRGLSQMPLRVTQAGLEVAERPRWTYDPAPIYNGMNDFVDQMVVSLLVRGNTFVYSLNEYSSGYPRQMMVLNPDMIHIEDNGGMPRYRVGDDTGPIIENDQVLHIRYTSWPGQHWGLSPLDAVSKQMGLSLSLEQYAYDIASQGGVPWGVLTTPGNLNSQQADDIKSRWLEASADRQSAPAILSGGMTLQPLALNPADMALLELGAMSDRRIAMAYGIQPSLLGIPVESSSTIQYANVSMVTDTLWRLTLRPLANTLSSALSHWALPFGTEAYFDADSFTRPDSKTRAETLKIMIETGVMSIDEARRYNGLPPLGVDADQENIIQNPSQAVI